ncbi:MAG: tetratricopeptide repeat protein [Desulfurivibrio sp.]|nr:tetratricopeptide repeat protein [Desulfurivibrio sp.]
MLEKGIEDGLVEEDLKNLKLLATAYTMSQEMDEAIGAWRDATKHAEDGQVYYRLAQALSREDRHAQAVEAYRGALDEGDLNDPADAQFWMGISLMQLERWDEATRAFRSAAKDDDKEKSARQYIQYIDGERRRQEELRKMVDDTADTSAPDAPARQPADD